MTCPLSAPDKVKECLAHRRASFLHDPKSQPWKTNPCELCKVGRDRQMEGFKPNTEDILGRKKLGPGIMATCRCGHNNWRTRIAKNGYAVRECITCNEERYRRRKERYKAARKEKARAGVMYAVRKIEKKLSDGLHF